MGRYTAGCLCIHCLNCPQDAPVYQADPKYAECNKCILRRCSTCPQNCDSGHPTCKTFDPRYKGVSEEELRAIRGENSERPS